MRDVRHGDRARPGCPDGHRKVTALEQSPAARVARPRPLEACTVQGTPASATGCGIQGRSARPMAHHLRMPGPEDLVNAIGWSPARPVLTVVGCHAGGEIDFDAVRGDLDPLIVHLGFGFRF